jgi:Tol biopolymer transport system component
MRMRILALLLAVLASLGVLDCQMLNRSSATEGAQGRIVWPKDADLWIYDVAGKQQQKITSIPSSAAITGASWSPDGKRVVFSQFSRRSNERASGADLFVSNADGSDARLFAERDVANTVLDAPQWAPSGRVYFTQRRVENGRQSLAVMRQTEGGQPETVVENGYNASISPDESTLVYIRDTRTGQVLMKKTLSQGGDGCELLTDQVFQYLSQPRISPDGTRVALAGSGEPNMQTSGCGGDNKAKPGGATPLLNLVALFEPAVAYAHGLPADMYTLALDGSGLTRVADIKDDDPTVTWSPDGARLAIFGIGALYMAEAKGGPATKLVEQGGYGSLDWTR